MKIFGLQDADYFNAFSAISDETVVLNASGVIVGTNDAWNVFCAENGGDIATSYVNTNYLNVCSSASGRSSAEAKMVKEGLLKVLSDGHRFQCEYPCDSPSEKRWFELTASRFHIGNEFFAVVQHRNITTRYVQQLEASKAHINAETLAALVATSNDAILSYDLDCKIISWNSAAAKLYGYDAHEAIGQSLEMIYPNSWPIRIEEYRDQIIAGTLTNFEARRIAKNGSVRDVWISCAPIRGPLGDVVAVSNIHRDITEAKRQEETRLIVSREITHRAKNILAVVNAIQRQTALTATSVDDFSKKFDERIRSLVSSTDLLVNSQWESVDLNELAKSQLKAFSNDVKSKLSLDGPPTRLRPQAVQVIGMGLHELATNAAKHGALQLDGGRVNISWEPNAACDLHFTWMETGLSFQSMPQNRGFGHTVLTRLASSMLDSEASLDFGASGLQWRLTVPAHFLH